LTEDLYKIQIEASGITSGLVFQGVRRYGHLQAEAINDQVVAMLVKRYAKAAGLGVRRFAGHSLRSGLVTQAAVNGVPERVIQNQTRHKSADMVRRYVREASLFRENASAKVGL
jgi:integrase